MLEGGNSKAFREAALFMDRHRSAIEAEVDRQLGRSEPPPAARAEIIRRFRSFCRLASIDISAARPSLDGLNGTSAHGLESAIVCAVEAACRAAPPPEIAEALRWLETRFRSGIRRVMQPDDTPKRGKRKKRPNAGRRVRAAIDRIGDAYIVLCLDTGRVYDYNPAAETLLAAEGSDLLHRSFEELIGAEGRSSFDDLEARLDAGEDHGTADLVFTRPNGECVPVEASVANHTIGGKRLAIFVARERAATPL